MLLTMRDIQANLALADELEKLRLSMLLRQVAGETPSAEEWNAGEAQAVRTVRETFFIKERASLYLAPEDLDAYDGESDYENRSTRSGDLAILESHRLIAAIPVAGAPEHACEPLPSSESRATLE